VVVPLIEGEEVGCEPAEGKPVPGAGAVAVHEQVLLQRHVLAQVREDGVGVVSHRHAAPVQVPNPDHVFVNAPFIVRPAGRCLCVHA